MTKRIFINYRRDDVKADARDLHNRLKQHFGQDSIFIDVDGLELGKRFDDTLDEALSNSDLFLCVIGPRWFDQFHERAKSTQPDYVATEIQRALSHKIKIIPILVDGATLPAADELPREIRDIVMFQAHEVSHSKFGRDVNDLISQIEELRGQRAPPKRPLIATLLGGVAVVVLAWTLIQITVREHKQQEQGTVLRDGGEQVTNQAAPAPEDETNLAALGGAKSLQHLSDRDRLLELLEHNPQDVQVIQARLSELGFVEIATGNGSAWLVPGSGEKFRDCTDCPALTVVPIGSMVVPSSSDVAGMAARQLSLQSPIAVGVYEVTFREWDACYEAKGCSYRPSTNWGRDNQPVINVSWNDTQEYVGWLKKKTGQQYRLLTGPEWEFAARAGAAGAYATGATITRRDAEFFDRAGGTSTSPKNVGSFPPNAYGLHDVHGNVFEWVSDCGNNDAGEAAGTIGDKDCASKFVRGGAWDVPAKVLKLHRQVGFAADTRSTNIGFRVARDLE